MKIKFHIPSIKGMTIKAFLGIDSLEWQDTSYSKGFGYEVSVGWSDFGDGRFSVFEEGSTGGRLTCEPSSNGNSLTVYTHWSGFSYTFNFSTGEVEYEGSYRGFLSQSHLPWRSMEGVVIPLDTLVEASSGTMFLGEYIIKRHFGMCHSDYQMTHPRYFFNHFVKDGMIEDIDGFEDYYFKAIHGVRFKTV